MKRKHSHNTKPRLLAALVALIVLLNLHLAAAERIVVLNPAVSPILKQLNLDAGVVGVTYNDLVYTNQTRVGSHLSPNIELIKALQPDWLIVGSKRAFSDELAGRFVTRLFRYDPRDLNEILETITQMGNLFDRKKEAKIIIEQANVGLKSLKKFSQPVTVVFEISQRPLKVAGQQNIVNSIITAAGGVNLVIIDKKHVLISPEKVLVFKPQFYVYQNGPMNKNPIPPRERNYFRSLSSSVLEVEQLQFTRPGLNAFEAVVYLNQQFAESIAMLNN